MDERSHTKTILKDGTTIEYIYCNEKDGYTVVTSLFPVRVSVGVTMRDGNEITKWFKPRGEEALSPQKMERFRYAVLNLPWEDVYFYTHPERKIN